LGKSGAIFLVPRSRSSLDNGRGKEFNSDTLVMKAERKPLGRLRHGWEDDIKMAFQELE
jgi:hypothetical protein